MSSYEQQEEFLNKIIQLSTEKVWKESRNVQTQVVRFKTPSELEQLLDLGLNEMPTEEEKLFAHCESIVSYSVKTGHPRFFNQLFCGLDTYGFAGQILTDALNGAMYTFETAPVFTLMERAVLKKMRDFVGFEAGEGTMCPGGTYSNMLGINLARFHKFPRVKDEGMAACDSIVLFTSEQCHYSINKSACLLGIGLNNVILVKCDDNGKMIAEDLEQKITEAKEKGHLPFMVNATAGTTVLGAFDPIKSIAAICKKNDLWLHVDAAWGGGCLLSKKHKHLCDGIESADSVTWNPHKLMMVPQQCSVFLVKKKGIMKECHGVNVPYLFQCDKRAYDTSFDVGNQIIQCGRKVDVLKLWMMWKAKGTLGFRDQIDKAFANAQYLTTQIKLRSWYKLIVEEPECTNVSFWFIPPKLRSWCNVNQEAELILPPAEAKQFWHELSQVAPKVKQRMQKAGTMMITYTSVGSKVNFFRMIIINPIVSKTDMDFVLDEIERLSVDL